MNATELIKAGRLAEARESLSGQVKSAPTDLNTRFLLFQVLAYLGEWDKAERHLEISAMQAPERESLFRLYRNLVAAERSRAEVEEGRKFPDFMTAPPLFCHEFVTARSSLFSGRPAEFSRALESLDIPEVSGIADGVSFQGFSDCDPGSFWFLEAFVHDRYLWFPFESLREITIPGPAKLLDLLWAPASLVTFDGLTTDCYLPVLYSGSSAHGRDQVRMGRVTEWKDLGDGLYRGIGQRLFQVGEEEKGILELRSISFTHSGRDQ